MSLEKHLHAVAGKRASLKLAIANEMARPMPDFNRIHDLKKQNLILKEEMQSCYEQMKQKAS